MQKWLVSKNKSIIFSLIEEKTVLLHNDETNNFSTDIVHIFVPQHVGAR
jgi:hypothetical protein